MEESGEQLSAGLTLGFGLVFCILGSVGLGVTTLLLVVSSVGLLSSSEKKQGFSILGIVVKVLSIPCLLLVSVLAFRPIAYVVYTAIGVVLIGSIVGSIVICVLRKKAIL